MRYIGLDIGDGESAATLVMDNGAMTQEVLTLGSSRNIISVVGMLDGKPVVGDEALIAKGVTERSARFKSRFLNDSDPEDLRRFVEGLYSIMNQTAKHALNGNTEDIRIALGRPAGWDENSCRRYAEIATNSGFPNVHTVSESRAAFLYVHYDRQLQISRSDLERPCLVIDIGSSTTDFAYIVDGRESNVGVFGQNHLGGGLIDKLILEDAVADCAPADRKKLAEIFEEEPSWYSYCELHARKQKERYFTQESAGYMGDINSSARVYADVDNPVFISFCLNKKKMDKLLSKSLEELDGDNFVKGLENALKHAKKLTASPAPELLILTGGASRMTVFRECCKEAFPNAEILICPEPEFSIARGLGIAARIDHQVSGFRDEMEAFFKNDMLQKEISKNSSSLKEAIIPEIANIVLENGFTPALKLAGQDGVESTEEFLQNVEGYISDYMQDNNSLDSLRLIAQKWASDNLIDTQKAIDEMCAKYYVDSAKLKFSDMPIRLDDIDFSKIKLPLLFSGLLKALNFSVRFEIMHKRINKTMLELLLNMQNGNSSREKVQKQIKEDLMKDSDLTAMLCQLLTDELRKSLNKHAQEAEIMLK